jgi:hypothetical protein
MCLIRIKQKRYRKTEEVTLWKLFRLETKPKAKYVLRGWNSPQNDIYKIGVNVWDNTIRYKNHFPKHQGFCCFEDKKTAKKFNDHYVSDSSITLDYKLICLPIKVRKKDIVAEGMATYGRSTKCLMVSRFNIDVKDKLEDCSIY